MRLLFIGPPGSGKGTQAKRIAAKYNIPHISTGDILREAIRSETPVGNRAKFYVESGGLVPDDVMLDIISGRLAQPDTTNGFILDGFPRTDKQASNLYTVLGSSNRAIQASIVFDCPNAAIVDRVCGRRVCPVCGAVYHIKYQLPKSQDTCDNDNSKLLHRSDDSEETIIKRLDKYYRELGSVTKYFISTLQKIDANQSPETVLIEIENVIKCLGK